MINTFFMLLYLFNYITSSCGSNPRGKSLANVRSPVFKEIDGSWGCPWSPVTQRYSDPTRKNCGYYFLCHKGKAFPRPCPVRQVFHPILRECRNREEVPETVCNFEIECHVNGYKRDPKDCTKYYLCFYHQPTLFSCTSGKIFDPHISQCISNPSMAKHCMKPTPLPHYTSTNKDLY